MKCVVFGALGQVGMAASAAAGVAGWNVRALSHADCDIRDEDAVSRALADLSAGDVVFNAAAKLGTDEPQTDPRPQFETNVRGAMFVATAAAQRGARIVHFSTDYVFDGRKEAPYVESDPPNPINAYGALKYASEIVVRGSNRLHYVVRIASVFGAARRSSKGLNFVDRMLELGRAKASVDVDDTITMSPTYAPDAVDVVVSLLKRGAAPGIYHAANAGSCSWRQFAAAIFDIAGLGVEVRARPPGIDKTPRPKNSALVSERLPALGIATRSWQDALRDYLALNR